MSDTGVHNHPHYLEDGSLDYSYTSGFKKTFPSLGEKVINNLQDYKNLMSDTINAADGTGSAIIQLDNIMDAAKKSEVAFLSNHGVQIDQNTNWGNLIIELNKTLGTESSFKRNILLLKQAIKDDGTLTKDGYRDIIRDSNNGFKALLQEEVYKAFGHLSLNADLGQVAQTAILQAFKRMSEVEERVYGKKIEHGKRGKIITPFNELYGQFNSLKQDAPILTQNMSFLIQAMSELFKLEEYLPQVRDQLSQGNVDEKDRLKITPKFGNARYQGSLQEIVETIVHDGLPKSGKNFAQYSYQTGPHNFKPDVILSSVELDYEDAYNKAKNSLPKDATVREKGILTMQNLIEQFYKKAKDLKDSMVIISDKEYIIGKMFNEGVKGKRLGGFGAQSDVSLNNLSSLFSAFHIEGSDISNLINYLANVGNAMIGGHIDQDVLKNIASKIAYFLFDDVQIEYPENNPNIIHVFNLSGIYVPLSFILNGVKQGLLRVEAKLRGNTYHNDFVSIKFKSSPEKPPDIPKQVRGDQTDWEQVSQPIFETFRNERMNNTTLTVHFLEGFAQAIAAEVNF